MRTSSTMPPESVASALPPARRRPDLGQLAREYGIVVALIVIVVALSFMNPYFLTVRNISNIFLQISINGFLATGMTFVMLAGGIDLSVGSVLAAGGIVAAGLVSGDHAYAPWVGILAGLGTGALLGAVNGGLVAYLRVPAFVATLGMLSTARGITEVYSGGMPIPDLADGFVELGQGRLFGITIPVWIYLACIVVAVVITRNTRFGRYVYAVGGNARSAVTSGINTKLVIFTTFVLSGLLAGLAGMILTARTTSGLPQAGIGYELDAIAAVVIGGTSLSGGVGTMVGSLLGALIIGVINNGLDLMGISSFYQHIIKGVIIVGAVLFDANARREQR
ncbi:ABC transporter permease [Acetobacteraceae bacterium KSS8]|uniref:ABC transporter permease n=1 Tax=Endosaccharibacter trunci TaxID=2812733 RepID=A0ABT1W9R1_9PROT|nr:ABC transporter permease [Acetobacteraceae bacterium KSS8]